MKSVAISDLHLDQSTAGVDRFPDVCKVIDHSVDHAIKIAADFFLFPGDLTDPNTARAHRSVSKLAQAQAKLWEAGVTPVFIPGNHDVIEDGSGNTVLDSLRWSNFGHVVTQPDHFVLTDKRGIPRCYFIALPFTASSHNYDPDAFIRQVAIDAPKHALPVLVMGHLNIEGITPGSETTDMPRGRDVYWPLAALKECFPHAMLVGGHYHTPQEFMGIHIVGSAVRLRFDEKDNQSGFSVLEF